MPGDIAALRQLRASLDAGGFLLVVVLVVVLLLLVIRRLRGREGGVARVTGTVLAALGATVAIAGIAELTLFGSAGLGAGPRFELDPVSGARGWSGIAWRPVIDNVTLFVPLGATLAALWSRRPWFVVLAVTVLVSVGVEAFQWAVPTGRIANTADVLANTVGAFVGVVLARLLEVGPDSRAVTRSARSARRSCRPPGADGGRRSRDRRRG